MTSATLTEAEAEYSAEHSAETLFGRSLLSFNLIYCEQWKESPQGAIDILSRIGNYELGNHISAFLGMLVVN